jgi:hypothetical protein
MQRHALFIVGMHRSGASALAAALARAGASPGKTMRAGNDGAPVGSTPLVLLNDRLLHALGSRWDGLAPLPERWLDRAPVVALAREAVEVIAAEYGDAKTVLFKDARLSFLIPFWRDVFARAGCTVAVAIVLRRPAEVAASLARLMPIAPEKSLALWLSHLVEAERGSRGMHRCLVAYDRLLASPAGEIAQVVSLCRLPLRLEGSMREQASAAVRRELKREGSDEPKSKTPALGSRLDTVLDERYARLARLAPGADLRAELEALAEAAYGSLLQAIPPWLAHELACDRASLQREAEALAGAEYRIRALEAELSQRRRDDEPHADNRGEAHASERELADVRTRSVRDERIDEALSRLRGDLSRIADTLADQPERERGLRDELASLERDLSDERHTIARLSDEIERLRAAAEQYRNQVEGSRADIEALIEEIERSRARHAARDAQERALQAEIDDAHEHARRLQSERDAKQDERDEALHRLASIGNELEALRRELAVVSGERDVLAAQGREVGRVVDALRDELARRASAEVALAALRDQLAAELRAASERVGTLEREIAASSTEFAALSARHEALAHTLAALEQRWIGRLALHGARRPPDA